jgi:Transcriptional regulator
MNDTREYIIDQAFELFLARSYEAVSINDISKAIGFTKGSLYYHFVNKEELFKAVLDKYLDLKVMEVDLDKTTFMEYTESLVNFIKGIVYRLFGNKSNFLAISYLRFFADGFQHYKGFADQNKNFFNSQNNQVIVALENAINRGEIRKDINVKAIALTYFSGAIGLTSNLLQDYSIEESMSLLKMQYDELYKLLKV